MRACHITNNAAVGVVDDVYEVPSLDFIPGLVDGSNGGNIGDYWDGTKFIPPAPVPAPKP